MTRLIVTRGLPASGKTTEAKRLLGEAEPGSLVRVNRDDLRDLMHGRGYHLHVTEKQVSLAQRASVEALLRSGVDVIVDDTNLRVRYLRAWVDLATKLGAELEVRDFTDVDVEECVRRDRDRARPVGEEVIRKAHSRFLAGQALPLPVPTPRTTAIGRPYVANSALPATVMVDVDGTVALHAGVREPFDTSRYHLDVPNHPVIAAVNSMYLAGHLLVFCSGRDDTYRDVTEEWLGEHVQIPYAGLFMRPAGDRRRDDVVKLELFDRHIRDQYAVTCVFDDRDRVVRAWRSIGLTVMQVAEGAF
ncbi:AAA family ATPase [Umezawaea tangerina]|uniref:Putative kinase n=1 Tax=Umezawaea tangerina TaxID=84725 RepID=A0A2T0SPQ5_9PSEU|nr:AAA family ATPase [Umezawaea tangerina]PRY35390.1 putative kinase [Umezawaea tangerina]